MPEPRRTRGGRLPLTADDVIDAALSLTHVHGTDGWTVRDLARDLGTWPNAIYHHVGDRDAVLAAVLERVVKQMPVPPADQPWEAWFRRLLTDGREVLRRYPGTAEQLCRDGPGVPSAAPIIDRGVGLLIDAGFGIEATRAYSLLLNSAFLLVAIADQRKMLGQAPHDVALNILRVPEPPGAGAGWTMMTGAMRVVAEDPALYDENAFFEYTLERTIEGLQHRLSLLRADDA